MARPPKKKIPVDGGGGRLGNPLAHAFAGLAGLAEGDTAPEPSPLSPAPAATPEKPGRRGVVLRRETAHRGGKTVVVLYDFSPPPGEEELRRLAKILRNACGSGGAVKGGEIEIQGDQPARIREILVENGYRVRGI